MIKITVAQTALRVIDYKSKKDGSAQQLRIQSAYAFTSDQDGNAPPFPEKFEIVLQREQSAYAVGDYQLHPSALYVDKDGRLACSPRLTPIRAKQTASA